MTSVDSLQSVDSPLDHQEFHQEVIPTHRTGVILCKVEKFYQLIQPSQSGPVVLGIASRFLSFVCLSREFLSGPLRPYGILLSCWP